MWATAPSVGRSAGKQRLVRVGNLLPVIVFRSFFPDLRYYSTKHAHESVLPFEIMPHNGTTASEQAAAAAAVPPYAEIPSDLYYQMSLSYQTFSVVVSPSTCLGCCLFAVGAEAKPKLKNQQRRVVRTRWYDTTAVPAGVPPLYVDVATQHGLCSCNWLAAFSPTGGGGPVVAEPTCWLYIALPTVNRIA